MPPRAQAPTALIYGVSGIGKSLAALRALTPEKTLWISTERGALKSAGNPALNPWHPRRPREVVCLHGAEGADDLQVAGEFERAVQTAVRFVERGELFNIVIDTLSSYARRLDYQVRVLGEVGREYGRASQAVAADIDPFLDRLYETVATVQRPNGVCGATLVCLCHERAPFQPAADKKGRRDPPTPGGPDLPGALRDKIRHHFDLVLRADVRYAAGGKRRVFVHDSMDKMWPSKDRWGVVPDKAYGGSGVMPLDLGAILRVGAALDTGRDPAEADLAVLQQYDGAAAGNGAAAEGAADAADLVSL